ncbi:MAG: DNA polymerase III subunit gamma/tau [Chloroflexi bacterium]|nr:DNA polymerase III subunit gamma/tau [Chloroflexota bacterium]
MEQMSVQVFYRKWRPKTLSEVAGQEHITTTLLNALATGRVAHAFLFCGPRGTGKTSTGRILAKAVNCIDNNGKGEPCNKCNICVSFNESRAMDLIEIDAASNRGIDEIRNIREKVNYAPDQSRYKVYIIDEVHMMTDPAFNALLKTLEEPPSHVIFILATTEVHKIPPTILSRCQRFDFRRIPQAAVIGRLQYTCDNEGIKTDTQVLGLIARASSGSLRDAENLLERLTIYNSSEIALRQVQELLGMTGDQRIGKLARHILSKETSEGLTTISNMTGEGLDPRQINKELVEYFRNLLMIKVGIGQTLDLTTEIYNDMKIIADTSSADAILKIIKLFSQSDFRHETQSTLPLELALVECTLNNQTEVKSQVTAETTPVTVKKNKPEPVKQQYIPVSDQKPATIDKKIVAEAPVIKKPEHEEKTVILEEETTLPTNNNSIEYIKKRWKEIVQASHGVGSGATLQALLRSGCSPVSLEGTTIVLDCNNNSFVKGKIEDQKYKHLVEEIISKVLGFNYTIQPILSQREKKTKSKLIDAALEMGAQIINDEPGGN